MTLFLYLAKVLLSSAILYGYYRLFLRNKQFHHYNRFYLLSALVVSILLPFIKIPVLYTPGNAVNEAVYQTINVLTVNHWENEVQATAGNSFSRLFTFENALYVFYMPGVIVLVVLLAKSLLYIKRIRKKYKGESINYLKFYNTKEPGTPFSFFRSIFWNDQLAFNSREGQQIFRHELFHVQQKHSADILLAEIITVLFWCNPIFYLIKKEIKAIHEFLADQYAASGSDRYAYAELLVQQTLEAKRLSGTNHFFQNHIKRRIAMITQFQQSRYGYWSRVMILPVSILLFCAFSLYTQQQPAAGPSAQSFYNAIEPITIIVDPGHGGTDNGALSYDAQLKEKDIALQISKQIQQLGTEYKINVVLTRSDDHLPGNAATPKEGLLARTNLAQQTNAVAFISIHASAAPKVKQGNDFVPNPSSGFEVFITNKSGSIQEPSRKLGMSIIHSISGLYTTKPSLMQRKEQGIWVLDNASCPAVIVECGFITNDKDVAFITDEINQQAIAKKILEGIVHFKNNPASSTSYADPKAGKEHSPKPAEPIIASYAVRTNKNSSNTPISTKTPGNLDINKVRKLQQHKTSLKEVQQLFGNPGEVIVTARSETWFYKEPTNQLKVEFNRGENQVVTDFNYTAFEITTPAAVDDSYIPAPPADTILKPNQVEIMSQFPGGSGAFARFVGKTLIYPKEAIDKKVEGKVVIQFIVHKDGTTSNIKAVSGPEILHAEAERVMKESGKWLPAVLHGKKVTASQMQPVLFSLVESTTG